MPRHILIMPCYRDSPTMNDPANLVFDLRTIYHVPMISAVIVALTSLLQPPDASPPGVLLQHLLRTSSSQTSRQLFIPLTV